MCAVLLYLGEVLGLENALAELDEFVYLAFHIKAFKVKLQGLIVKNVLVEDWD